MKVLHLNDVANVGAELTKGLRNAGVESSVYRLNLPMGKGEQERTFLKLLSVPYLMGQLIAFNRQVRGQAADIVHIHAAYLGLAGLMGRYPYVLHCHGWDLYMNLYRPTLRALTVKCLKAAAAVLYSTPNLKQYLDELDVPAVFLPNPVDIDMFSPSVGRRSSLKNILVNVRFETVKGVDVIFKVLKKFEAVDPSLRFYCFNWGNRANECRKFSNVIMLEPVAYKKVPEIIKSCGLFVGQFSDMGGIGLAELEAMACGLPVISYFIYGGAYDVPPPVISSNDPDQIVSLVDDLVHNPAAAELLGRRGREWVVNYHSLPAVTRQLRELYDSVLVKN